MKHGDFSILAKYYSNRPGYSPIIIKTLISYIGALKEGFVVADIGAGTGKLTSMLDCFGIGGFAVEPSNNMRIIGEKSVKNFMWSKGIAEDTGLKNSSVDWVMMASSFHWADSKKALKEFYRILKPGGFLTILWNPRDIEKSEVEKAVELIIKNFIPNLKRVSSGSQTNTKNWGEVLTSGKKFKNLVFMEAPHFELMSKERYLGVWRSVNDIQVQAGKLIFQKILKEISKIISSKNLIRTAYKTRAWTVQSIK
ncbi:class I SAM-dependent methyltransferase [Candidatus Daviesbacteria bacterium]|nr:class I SAM-dependent methyltransferase [Candidatus Daviesbacteria bacterium]